MNVESNAVIGVGNANQCNQCNHCNRVDNNFNIEEEL